MHPHIIGEIADVTIGERHREAERARLVASARRAARSTPGTSVLRRRLGARLIALGEAVAGSRTRPSLVRGAQ